MPWQRWSPPALSGAVTWNGGPFLAYVVNIAYVWSLADCARARVTRQFRDGWRSRGRTEHLLVIALALR